MRSAPLLSLASCAGYMALAVSITTAASFNEMCGDGDLRPSCGMFIFGVALYGILAIGAVTTIVWLIAVVLRRRFPQLLKVSSILYALALTSVVFPVLLGGNKFAGAILLIAAFPFTFLLLTAQFVCFALWVGDVACRRFWPRMRDAVGSYQKSRDPT